MEKTEAEVLDEIEGKLAVAAEQTEKRQGGLAWDTIKMLREKYGLRSQSAEGVL